MELLRDLYEALPEDLARQALTHSSWVQTRSESYERLAFLGDSVLGLAVTTHLWPRLEPAAFGALLVEEGVAQRAQEVAEVVLVAEQARAPEDACVGFLDKVLGVLAGARERPGGPVEPIEVVSEARRLE